MYVSLLCKVGRDARICKVGREAAYIIPACIYEFPWREGGGYGGFNVARGG